ncbi:Uncharacterized protein APZ42_007988 [Daphnia magna]|uniref:Uncharacterized protein n=1 Tax=Daphnia magna TaxID=35525 RepID=A0A164EY70_9CRUS|nr:Uncharacterized protein APZ42_007988 [Daphnia magna]
MVQKHYPPLPNPPSLKSFCIKPFIQLYFLMLSYSPAAVVASTISVNERNKFNNYEVYCRSMCVDDIAVQFQKTNTL